MDYSLVKTTSSFPVSNRPIYIHPITPVTRRNKDNAYPIIARAVRSIAEQHPEERILVHTVSYDLAQHIVSYREKTPDVSEGDEQSDSLQRSRFVTYTNSSTRERAIREYRENPGSILVASSLERGIDLPKEHCGVIVICKIPYPNLGDKQVSARLHLPGGQLWYNVQTVRALVQMTGRGMRSADDHCISYILDAQFMDIYKKNGNLLPKWWKDAIVQSSGNTMNMYERTANAH